MTIVELISSNTRCSIEAAETIFSELRGLFSSNIYLMMAWGEQLGVSSPDLIDAILDTPPTLGE